MFKRNMNRHMKRAHSHRQVVTCKNCRYIESKNQFLNQINRTGHVPTFLKSFFSVLEQGPEARLIHSQSSFSIIPFSFCYVLRVHSQRAVHS